MPQSTAGLIRYFEQTDQTIQLKPEYIIISVMVIIVLELGLKFLF
jgi:preprotein translocase subunit Sec61beta